MLATAGGATKFTVNAVAVNKTAAMSKHLMFLLLERSTLRSAGTKALEPNVQAGKKGFFMVSGRKL
jgi:hypothetical protein